MNLSSANRVLQITYADHFHCHVLDLTFCAFGLIVLKKKAQSNKLVELLMFKSATKLRLLVESETTTIILTSLCL